MGDPNWVSLRLGDNLRGTANWILKEHITQRISRIPRIRRRPLCGMVQKGQLSLGGQYFSQSKAKAPLPGVGQEERVTGSQTQKDPS
jgi:hypothetical protein